MTPHHTRDDYPVDRVVAEGVYELTVFFVRHQGFIRATSAGRISFEESLVFERLHVRLALWSSTDGAQPVEVGRAVAVADQLLGLQRPRRGDDRS